MARGLGFVLDSLKRNQANRKLQKANREKKFQRIGAIQPESLKYQAASPEELAEIRQKTLQEEKKALTIKIILLTAFFTTLFFLLHYFN